MSVQSSGRNISTLFDMEIHTKGFTDESNGESASVKLNYNYHVHFSKMGPKKLYQMNSLPIVESLYAVLEEIKKSHADLRILLSNISERISSPVHTNKVDCLSIPEEFALGIKCLLLPHIQMVLLMTGEILHSNESDEAHGECNNRRYLLDDLIVILNLVEEVHNFRLELISKKSDEEQDMLLFFTQLCECFSQWLKDCEAHVETALSFKIPPQQPKFPATATSSNEFSISTETSSPYGSFVETDAKNQVSQLDANEIAEQDISTKDKKMQEVLRRSASFDEVLSRPESLINPKQGFSDLRHALEEAMNEALKFSSDDINFNEELGGEEAPSLMISPEDMQFQPNPVEISPVNIGSSDIRKMMETRFYEKETWLRVSPRHTIACNEDDPSNIKAKDSVRASALHRELNYIMKYDELLTNVEVSADAKERLRKVVEEETPAPTQKEKISPRNLLRKQTRGRYELELSEIVRKQRQSKRVMSDQTPERSPSNKWGSLKIKGKFASMLQLVKRSGPSEADDIITTVHEISTPISVEHISHIGRRESKGEWEFKNIPPEWHGLV